MFWSHLRRLGRVHTWSHLQRERGHSARAGGFQTSLLLTAFSLILQVEQDMAGPLSFSVEQVFLLRHNCLR